MAIGEEFKASADLCAKIQAIPNDGEWWHGDGGEMFISLAERLLTYNFTEDEALDFLQTVYAVVASEFGS